MYQLKTKSLPKLYNTLLTYVTWPYLTLQILFGEENVAFAALKLSTCKNVESIYLYFKEIEPTVGETLCRMFPLDEHIDLHHIASLAKQALRRRERGEPSTAVTASSSKSKLSPKDSSRSDMFGLLMTFLLCWVGRLLLSSLRTLLNCSCLARQLTFSLHQTFSDYVSPAWWQATQVWLD